MVIAGVYVNLQVPPERMECLFNTFAYDHRADGMVVSRPYPLFHR